MVTGPVDTSLVVTTDAFRACVQEVAADDRVDAVLAVAVPTAFSDLSAAVAEAAVSKPLAVALLDRAESVQRLRRLPVETRVGVTMQKSNIRKQAAHHILPCAVHRIVGPN